MFTVDIPKERRVKLKASNTRCVLAWAVGVINPLLPIGNCMLLHFLTQETTEGVIAYTRKQQKNIHTMQAMAQTSMDRLL